MLVAVAVEIVGQGPQHQVNSYVATIIISSGKARLPVEFYNSDPLCLLILCTG